MSMKRCGACGAKYRGKGVRATVLQGRSSAARIVCPACTAKATPVLAPEATRCACGAPATICATCTHRHEERDRKGILVDVVKKLDGQLRIRKKQLAETKEVSGSPEWCVMAGYIEGMESSIEQLRRAL